MEYGKISLGGLFKHFLFHPDNWGRWTQFGDHIFQVGGSTTNYQLPLEPKTMKNEGFTTKYGL